MGRAASPDPASGLMCPLDSRVPSCASPLLHRSGRPPPPPSSPPWRWRLSWCCQPGHHRPDAHPDAA